jgi:hypothetical protein
VAEKITTILRRRSTDRAFSASPRRTVLSWPIFSNCTSGPARQPPGCLCGLEQSGELRTAIERSKAQVAQFSNARPSLARTGVFVLVASAIFSRNNVPPRAGPSHQHCNHEEHLPAGNSVPFSKSGLRAKAVQPYSSLCRRATKQPFFRIHLGRDSSVLSSSLLLEVIRFCAAPAQITGSCRAIWFLILRQLIGVLAQTAQPSRI